MPRSAPRGCGASLADVYARRLERLAELAREKHTQGAVVSGASVYYFTGFRGSGLLVYRLDGEPVLLVPPLEYARAAAVTGGLPLSLATYKAYRVEDELFLAPGQRVVDAENLCDAVAKLLGGAESVAVATEESRVYTCLSGRYKVEDIAHDVAKMRSIKEPWELERILVAVAAAEAALRRAIEALEAGVTEQEIAAVIEEEIRRRGGEGHSFPPIVAFGGDASYPHWEPSSTRRLGPGEPVLIDLGAVYRGYCSDMTRTIMPRGAEEAATVAEAVLEAADEAIDTVAPGVKASEVDRAAREVLRRHGLGQYFIHGLGHGVGIEVHEHPRLAPGSDEVLEPGMVVTIEPGVYMPGRLGVRVEDMVLVTKRGAKLLTSYPRRLW